jgi:hypothetical protein
MSNQHSVHAGGAQLTGPSGQQPEQKSVLGFPVRPEGDGEAVAGSRHHWYELAQEVHGRLLRHRPGHRLDAVVRRRPQGLRRRLVPALRPRHRGRPALPGDGRPPPHARSPDRRRPASDTANEMMVERLRAALEAGQRITGADASFCMHELAEATMMPRGIPYGGARRRTGQIWCLAVQRVCSRGGRWSRFNQNWIEFWTARGEL